MEVSIYVICAYHATAFLSGGISVDKLATEFLSGGISKACPEVLRI
jgi:hypothetical protein